LEWNDINTYMRTYLYRVPTYIAHLTGFLYVAIGRLEIFIQRRNC